MSTIKMSLREFNRETSGHDKTVVTWFDKYYTGNSDDLILSDEIVISFDEDGSIIKIEKGV